MAQPLQPIILIVEERNGCNTYLIAVYIEDFIFHTSLKVVYIEVGPKVYGD